MAYSIQYLYMYAHAYLAGIMCVECVCGGLSMMLAVWIACVAR